MIVQMDFVYSREGLANMTERKWRKVRRGAYFASAHYWIDKILPKHFTQRGGREYNYALRDGERRGIGSKSFFRSYTGIKQRKKGHRNPLEWSGKLKRESAQSKPTGTFKGVTIRIKGRVLNFKPGKNKIDMAREISAISGRDVRSLITVLQDYIDQNLEKAGGRRTVKIKVF